MRDRVGRVLGFVGRQLQEFPDVRTDPGAAWLRLRDKIDTRWEYSRPPCRYAADPSWERGLHEHVGAAWPCPSAAEFDEVWPKIAAVVVGKGYRFGPESYFGWNDGDPAFVRALWCLVRHLRPRVVVETGVGHGISTRLMLEALERNGEGRLFSVDKMHLDPAVAAQIGIAVDGFAAERWRLVEGPVRRVLPELLQGVGRVDLFVHDSLHTRRHVCYEVRQARRVLSPGGFIVIDDIDTNRGLQTLQTEFPRDRFWICESAPVRPDLRRFNERGLFAIIQPPVER